ncbi:hypothetical protein PFISCL1PPCAC_26453, partial [Pristionchus fissidentatus]
ENSGSADPLIPLMKPTISRDDIRALAAVRVSLTLFRVKTLVKPWGDMGLHGVGFKAFHGTLSTFLNPWRIHDLDVLPQLNEYERHTFHRISGYFEDQVYEEYGIPHYKTRETQEMINQDKNITSDNAYAEFPGRWTNANEAYNEMSPLERLGATLTAQRVAAERTIAALDHLLTAVKTFEAFYKIARPTVEDEKSITGMESRMSEYEKRILTRLALHFIDEVEKEYGVPHHHSPSEQAMIDQDKVGEFDDQ